MSLTFTKPDLESATWNVMLYGPGGNGKTVGACSAPGPILLVNADGPDGSRKTHAIYGDKIREVPFEGPQTLDEVYLYLQGDEGKEIKTLVLDPLGEIYQKIFEQLGGERKDVLKNHGDTQTKIERFVRTVRDLDVNVVLVCHEEVADQEGETIRRPLTGGKKLPEKLIGMMSIVGYCGVIPADKDKGTPPRWVAQLAEAKGRRAKDRSGGLGFVRDIDLEEWFAVATEAAAKGAEPQEAPADEEKADQAAADKKADAETKEDK